MPHSQHFCTAPIQIIMPTSAAHRRLPRKGFLTQNQLPTNTPRVFAPAPQDYHPATPHSFFCASRNLGQYIQTHPNRPTAFLPPPPPSSAQYKLIQTNLPTNTPRVFAPAPQGYHPTTPQKTPPPLIISKPRPNRTKKNARKLLSGRPQQKNKCRI